jgi:DNA-binding response OmpR family regulator
MTVASAAQIAGQLNEQGTFLAEASRGSILLVEDDAPLALLETGMLSAHGYAVTLVSSGEQALAALADFSPDLVLLDLDLPGLLNGWDVFSNLRLRTSTSTTPVLLTSADSTAHAKVRAHSETRLTLDHLPKPDTIPSLLKRIERMLT